MPIINNLKIEKFYRIMKLIVYTFLLKMSSVYCYYFLKYNIISKIV